MFVWLSNLRYQYLSKYYYIDKRAYLFTTLDLRTLQTSFGCTQRPHRCRLFYYNLIYEPLERHLAAPNGHTGAVYFYYNLIYEPLERLHPTVMAVLVPHDDSCYILTNFFLFSFPAEFVKILFGTMSSFVSVSPFRPFLHQ